MSEASDAKEGVKSCELPVKDGLFLIYFYIVLFFGSGLADK